MKVLISWTSPSTLLFLWEYEYEFATDVPIFTVPKNAINQPVIFTNFYETGKQEVAPISCPKMDLG